MAIDWKPFVDIVHANQSFVLTSHARPDCDAIGSELGMAYLLEALGKQVRIINADAPPNHIAFIDPEGRVEVIGEHAQAADAHAADVHIILDTNAWGQLGNMAEVFRSSPAKKVVIDHHVSRDDLQADVFKDVTAEATGRLVVEACEAFGVGLTKQMAVPLFCAIATDTGWFRFPSVNEQTYLTIAKLVSAGAEPSAIFSQLFDKNTLERVCLHGLIMAGIERTLQGRVTYSEATSEDFATSGAEMADTEDVVNRLLSVEGVEVSVLFVEMNPEQTKVSLRSRSDFDVRKIAEKFGGGGHIKAAGVRYGGSVSEARKAVLDAIRDSMG